jgi:hypothetical protein
MLGRILRAGSRAKNDSAGLYLNSDIRTRSTRPSIMTSACSPSRTSRRKTAARPFHKTGMLARQTGVVLGGTRGGFALTGFARLAAG